MKHTGHTSPRKSSCHSTALPLILQEPPARPASRSGGGLSLSPHKAESLCPQRQAHGCSRSEEWTVARHSHQRLGWWLNSMSFYQQFCNKIPVLPLSWGRAHPLDRHCPGVVAPQVKVDGHPCNTGCSLILKDIYLERGKCPGVHGNVGRLVGKAGNASQAHCTARSQSRTQERRGPREGQLLCLVELRREPDSRGPCRPWLPGPIGSSKPLTLHLPCAGCHGPRGMSSSQETEALSMKQMPMPEPDESQRLPPRAASSLPQL